MGILASGGIIALLRFWPGSWDLDQAAEAWILGDREVPGQSAGLPGKREAAWWGFTDRKRSARHLRASANAH